LRTQEVLQAWDMILRGARPSVSIEITRECPLRCPGCYAYAPSHIGPDLSLRSVRDLKGDDLVLGVLSISDKLRPSHMSLAGGDPLVRQRELTVLVPALTARGIHVQIVTSAFRELPALECHHNRLNWVVSVDGLPPEHDESNELFFDERG
jgi:MoaA/NifB/PqqE/SkfB family radical SAM enzyme